MKRTMLSAAVAVAVSVAARAEVPSAAGEAKPETVASIGSFYRRV